jgi:molecular chaperone GrpE (heat shock protein)
MSTAPDESVAEELAAETAAEAPDSSADEPTSTTHALRNLEVQVARFHERAERQEQIIRSMQERIVDLQGDQVLALLKPLLIRFAGLHAQARDAAQSAQQREELAANDLAFFATSIEEALGLLDLDSVNATVGEAFDSTRHAATAATPTGDAQLDRTVSRVVRQGFAFPDAKRVTIPAQVTVYRYDESLAPAESDEAPMDRGACASRTSQSDAPCTKEPDTADDVTEGH